MKTHTQSFVSVSMCFALLVLTISVMPIPLALAFKPTDEGHLGISKEVLTTTTRVVNGETLKFSDRAVQEVRDANKATDSLVNQGDASLHFDDEAFLAATTRLQNLKQQIIGNITGSSPDGASARQDLGGAFHTLQDFYAHSNWVELGNISINSLLGRGTFGGLPATTATCPNDPATLSGAGLSFETSGYFKIPLCAPPTGKCRHGVPLACPSGLNKDDSSRARFVPARALAVDATRDYLNQILNDPSVAGNARAIKALMDVRSTLGMVIDDTGSMGPIIDQVKAEVAQIVNSVRGTSDEPAQYLLQPFNDPGVPDAFATSNADDFLAAVNALFASGGGDCPELSMTGLLRAVAASQADATLFLFTDASSKDAFLANNVIAAAQSKGIKITPVIFGSCSPVDPAYVAIAQRTGGQLFFLAPFEAGKIFSLVKPQLPGDLVPIILVSGVLPGAPTHFAVPVDSSVRGITFSTTAEVFNSITITRPSGVVVGPGDPDVTVTALTAGSVITIGTPGAGTWTADLNASGSFSFLALANSSLQVNNFQFVELTGRPAHEGLFAIPGQPVVGVEEAGLATMSGPLATANFRLVSEAGAALASVALTQGNPATTSDQFFGTFVPPPSSFRVAVSGLDSLGFAYQRIFPTLFLAQTAQVQVSSIGVVALPAGVTTPLSFTVQNFGAADTFAITATDNHGFVTAVDPTSLNLPNGSSGNVRVDVRVPQSTPPGTNVVVSVVATSASNPLVANSAVLTLQVLANRPLSVPVLEETDKGGSSSSATVATATKVTAVSSHLYLAAIATKPGRVQVSSVSGLGMTWTLVKAQCGARNQTRVEVWQAQGTPAGDEAVRATLTAAPLNAVIVVSRYSGVNAASPIGDVVSANTLGVNGRCSGGTDSDSYSVELTTTKANALAYGAVAIRHKRHTPGAGYTEEAEVARGHRPGDRAGLAVEDKAVASVGTVAVDGTLSDEVDWAVIGVEVKP